MQDENKPLFGFTSGDCIAHGCGECHSWLQVTTISDDVFGADCVVQNGGMLEFYGVSDEAPFIQKTDGMDGALAVPLKAVDSVALHRQSPDWREGLCSECSKRFRAGDKITTKDGRVIAFIAAGSLFLGE